MNPFDQFDAPAPAAAQGPPDVEGLVRAEAQRQNVDPDLAVAIARRESGLNPGVKPSSAGATGVMQLMPGTASDMGVDPRDLAQNIQGGVGYLGQQLEAFGGDHRLAAAAYNAGPGAVRKAGGVPNFPETQKYVAAVAPASPANPFDVFDGGGAASAPSNEAPPAPAMGSDAQLPAVIDADTKQPYATPGVQKGLQTLLADGQIDPNAAPGSKAFPRGWKPGFQAGPGEWYVNPAGELKQMPSPTAGTTAADVGGGFLTGFARGTSGLADGLLRMTNPLASVPDTTKRIADIAEAATGARFPTQPKFSLSAGAADLANPTTTPGRYAETIGELAPNVLAPGSLPRKIADVVVPAVGGQALEDFAARHGASPLWQQVAKAAGMIGGSFASGLEPRLPTALPKVTPADLRTQANALYTDMRNRGVEFTPTAVKSLNQGLSDVVDAEGRNLYPAHANWADQVATTLAENPTVEALDKVRSKAQQALTTPTAGTTPDQLRVGSAMIDQIDQFLGAAARHPEFMTNATPQNAMRVQQDLSQARDLWRRMRNAETVSNLADSANIQNATSHMGGNAQNMTARKLRTFIDPSTNKSLAGLSPEETAQLRRVVLGTPLTETLKMLGNLSPHKGIGMFVAGAAAGHGEVLPAAMIGSAGFLANRAGVGLQRANLNRLLRMIASGQPGSPGGVGYQMGPAGPFNAGTLLSLTPAGSPQPQPQQP